MPQRDHRRDRRAAGSTTTAADVLPHERTLPKAKSDRLELLRATRANLDPIWGLSLATGLSALTDHVDGEPFATATDEDGVLHELWRITDPAAIGARSPTPWPAPARARRRPPPLRDRVHLPGRAARERHRRPRRRRDHDAWSWSSPPSQLCVRAIHRLLSGVAGVDLRDRAGRPVQGRCRGPQHARGRGRARDRDARERRTRARRPRRPRAAPADGPSSKPAWTDLPVELRDVDSARFDAGVLPRCPA